MNATATTSLVDMMSQALPDNSGGYGLFGAARAESTPSIEAVLDYLALFGGTVHLDAVSPAFVAIDSWRVVQEAIAKARAESKTLH